MTPRRLPIACMIFTLSLAFAVLLSWRANWVGATNQSGQKAPKPPRRSARLSPAQTQPMPGTIVRTLVYHEITRQSGAGFGSPDIGAPPILSDNGNRAVFVRYGQRPDDFTPRLFVAEADGSGSPRELLPGSLPVGISSYPDISADGSKVVYPFSNSDQIRIVDVGANSSTTRVLVSGGTTSRRVRISGDGSKVFYLRNSDNDQRGLYVINSDQSGGSRRIVGPAEVAQRFGIADSNRVKFGGNFGAASELNEFSVSRDGGRIVFLAQIDFRPVPLSVNLNGSDVVSLLGPDLATARNDNAAVAISADGVKVVYHIAPFASEQEFGIVNTDGAGRAGYGGDGGPATKAAFNQLYAVDINRAGDKLYITDLRNRRIRLLDVRSDVVTTIAGNGQEGVPADGAVAINSPLVDPRAAAVDSKGNVYILERRGNALRVLDKQSRIRTVVGPNIPSQGPGLNGPKHLCVDRYDNVIIADAENHLIRKYNPKDGSVAVIAGSGEKGDRIVPDDPLKTQLNRPHGVFAHPSGALYISDSYNHRILKMPN